jgi:hypothetical protein
VVGIAWKFKLIRGKVKRRSRKRCKENFEAGTGIKGKDVALLN